jgi:hypothetical protein
MALTSGDSSDPGYEVNELVTGNPRDLPRGEERGGFLLESRPVRRGVSKVVEDSQTPFMAGPGETLGSPWIPLAVRACLKVLWSWSSANVKLARDGVTSGLKWTWKRRRMA